MALTGGRAGAREYGRWIKLLLCGEPGSGKTRSSSTWKNPLFASAEGGLMSVADRQTPFFKIKTSHELAELLKILQLEPDERAQQIGDLLNGGTPLPVDTIILDTFDEMARIIMKERNAEKRQEAFTLQDWGWYADQLRAIVRAFRNLDMHVVFTCHLKETSDQETGKVTIKPAIQGAMGDEIPGFVDLALVLTARPTTKVVGDHTERSLVRLLQTFPDGRLPWIKDRSGRLPMELEIDFDNDYEKIDQLIFGGIDAAEYELAVQEAEAHAAHAAQIAEKAAPPPPPEPPKAEKRRNTRSKKDDPKPEAAEEKQSSLEPDGPGADGPSDPPAPEPTPEPEPEPEPPTPEPEPTAEAKPPVAAPAEAQDAHNPGLVVEDQGSLLTGPPEGVDAETGEIAQADEPTGLAEGMGPNGLPLCQADNCKTEGRIIESSDQVELSQIRFRKPMCRPCFIDARRPARSSA